MFFWRHGIALVPQEVERPDEPPPRRAGRDDVVHVAAPRRHPRVREGVLVFLDLDAAGFGGIARGRELAPVEDVDGAFSPHDGDLGGRPRVVEVRPDVFGGHDAVRAAIRLARDDRELRDRGLGERV